MDRRRLALLAGAAACLALLASVVAPYLTVPPPGTDVYYAAGWIGPIAAAVFALLALGLFGAALAGSISPPTAAGAVLVVGLSTVAAALLWAVSVPPSVVMELSRDDWLAYHRWVVVALAAAALASAAWYSVGAFRTERAG